jgi:restriction system protein
MAQSYWVRKQREQQRARLQAERAYRAHVREAARVQREHERNQALEEKERRRLYLASREAEVDELNADLAERDNELTGILAASLAADHAIEFEGLKERPEILSLPVDGLGLAEEAPALETPATPSGLARMVPGSKAKHARAIEQAGEKLSAELRAWEDRESQRKAALAGATAEHEKLVASIKAQTDSQHAEVDRFKIAFEAREPEALVNYFSLVLASSRYPDGFPEAHRVAFVPETVQLVVEVDLPAFDLIPEVKQHRYVKSRDDVTSTARPLNQRKAAYAGAVAQVALRTLHELFDADRSHYIESVVLNAFVDAIDPRTGHQTRPCLVTLRTTRDLYAALDLARVDPQACLRGLNASFSRSPSELVPVRPVLEFNMVDARFVEETDVISTIDGRPNLMELTPSEFENLITNLFERMGLETRLTQASRDGGVDCVAYDPRPIFGGKVVIQAKRYKNTVGVSAVRDLFGTLQNEGASKGILVTTSGYGKASFEFAEGKPLELLSGSNLLYLLEQHAGVTAKIEPPEDWVDPIEDRPDA